MNERLVMSIFTKLKALCKHYGKASEYINYRVVSVEKNESDEYEVTIQIIGKNLTFRRKPEELLAEDGIIEKFSHSDIRMLTYIGYLNVQSPQYKILSKKYSGHLNKMIFALHKKGEKTFHAKTASEIAVDEEILQDLEPKEAYLIGYMAASEQLVLEAEHIKQLREPG